jgi:hypothetical protein
VQQSGISFVQQNATDAGAASTNSTAFSNANTAGNLIVVVAAWGSTTISMSSLTDSAGNTYVSAAGPVNWNGAAPTSRQQIFYAKNIKGGANTVTAQLSSATANFFQLFIFEYSGADTISPLDAVSSASSSSGTAMNSGSATTTYANELIFGAGNITGSIPHPGTGFVNRSNFEGTMMEDKFVATASSYKATATGDGTAWIMMMVTFRAAGGSTLTLTPPSGTGVYVPTSTQVTIKIGSNATVGQQGGHWITNPSTGGVYTISVGGTFGGSGNMLVSINAGVSVQATVAESLSLSVSSIGALSCTADDGATITAIGTAATSVPFGTISANSFYQGCQDLVVSTNAGNGYSVTVQESSAMRTVDGRLSIPDTTCDGGTCTESVAAAWTNATKNGLGHTCFNQLNHDCNAAYSSGTNFRQAANLSAGETAQSVMSSSTAATATGRVKYRLSAGSAQPAGTYTTIISYTIYATY